MCSVSAFPSVCSIKNKNCILLPYTTINRYANESNVKAKIYHRVKVLNDQEIKNLLASGFFKNKFIF